MSPSEPSACSSQVLPDIEREQLLARIQLLEAAGHTVPTDWQKKPSMDGEDERRK